MAKSYSNDLRERVILCYNKGLPKNLIIILFDIGIDTLNRWIKQYKETGIFTPKERTKYRKRKFSDEDLLNYISNNSSATLQEIANYFSVTPPSIYSRLKKLNVTLKKLFYMKKEMKRKGKSFLAT